MVGFVSAFALLLAAPVLHDLGKRRRRPTDEQTHGFLNWVLAHLASVDCTEHVPVCMNEECSQVESKHTCPKPHQVHAVCCILVVALYAMLIINLRRTHSGTSRYVKSLEAKNGLDTQDYSVMVENPPADAVDPDEWYRFFSQFGQVAYVTVAKDDGDLVWKCLEPRLVMLQLYRDNPAALRDRISVLSNDDLGRIKRTYHSFSSFVSESDIVVNRMTKKLSRDSEEELDVGDADAGGGAEDTLVSMAPWYTGGHLRLAAKSLLDLAREGAQEERGGGALKLSRLQDPYARYLSPYVFWRWMQFELKQAFPHYVGTLSQQDRDMLAERLFEECPKNLEGELKSLDEGKRYNAVRVFVVFEKVKSRRECLDTLTAGGLLRTLFDYKRHDIPENFKFRNEKTLIVTEPPAPEQMIWWNLKASFCQRTKDEIFSVFVTSILILVAYYVALWASMTGEHEESQNTPQYLRNFLFSAWAQIYNQMCTSTFGWLASQEHHHDEDAKQLSLLLRYTLLKCITSIIFIVVTPRVYTLYRWNIAAMKTMLYADAVVGPLWRYIDVFNLVKRFLSRFLPNQPLMDWAHLSPAHDIADSYSNIVKTVFLGLFVMALVPSSPFLTAVSCLTGYWVDKHAICRVWSCHSHSKPAKYTAEAVQNLLGFALVATMMKTIQLYKEWPFDNLCHREGVFVEHASLWQDAGARDGQVWAQCAEHASSRTAVYSLALWAKLQPWMSLEHARAVRIYSAGSVLVTVVLALYFWGRSAWNLVYNLFCTHAVSRREDEDELPDFSDKKILRSAYIPQVKESNFMFPLLATDLSTMDTKHIPWHCNYELTNLARDIGDEAIEKGHQQAFSVVKRYLPRDGDELPTVEEGEADAMTTSVASSASSASYVASSASSPPSMVP